MLGFLLFLHCPVQFFLQFGVFFLQGFEFLVQGIAGLCLFPAQALLLFPAQGFRLCLGLGCLLRLDRFWCARSFLCGQAVARLVVGCKGGVVVYALPIQSPDFAIGLAKQPAVVGHHDQRAFESFERIGQCLAAFQIQVVGRLVQQEHIAAFQKERG